MTYVDEVTSVLSSPGESALGGVAFRVLNLDEQREPEEFVDEVRRAIVIANASAVDRNPVDPTWCTDGDLVGGETWAELVKGSFEDTELRAWFEDLRRAVAGIRLGPHPASGTERAPNLDAWYELPPSLTAYLYFTPVTQGQQRDIPPRVIDEVADALAAWCVLPGGIDVVSRGLSSFTISPTDASAELRRSARIEWQHRLASYLTQPKTGRMLGFDDQAKGVAQIVGSGPGDVDALHHLLTALRIAGPHLDYAYVRFGVSMTPSDQDVLWALGRPITAIEEEAAIHPARLTDRALDAYVAQVLNPAHMHLVSDLNAFEIEHLDPEHVMVVSRDPASWLAALEPPSNIQQAARHAFGEALLKADPRTRGLAY